MRMQSRDKFHDADILAYLNQDLEPDMAAELAAGMAADPALAARVAALQQEEAALQVTLFRVSCPDTLALSEYVAGLAPDGAPAGIQKHLAACPYCRQEAVQLERYLAAVRPDLETNLIKRARILVARLVSAATGAGQFGLQPAMGLRGDVAGPAMYAAEGVQLSLDVQDDPHQPGQKRILGLVLGAETADWQAQLWLDGRPLGMAAVDEVGNFTLAAAGGAAYELIIQGDEVTVHVPEFVVA